MLAIELFGSNYLELNEDEYHLFLSGYKHEKMFPNIEWSRIWESKKQKL